MTFFNILFTSWPPIAIAVFETDIPTEIIEEVCDRYLTISVYVANIP